MGDVSGTRPGNVRTRPLGEVKVESVYFDPPTVPSPALFTDNGDTHTVHNTAQRMNRLNENLITTALIGDVAAANTAPPTRKSVTAHGVSGSSVPTMHLISSLVTPRSRTISIPQQRTKNANGALLRINTAPTDFRKDKQMSDPCRSPVNSDNCAHDTSMYRNTKHTSSWGEYRRQLSTAKRKEMCRRMSELSKCDAVDMSDHSVHDDGRSPMMILSQVPQREKQYDELVERADLVLQRKKTLPSVFITKQKRPGSLVREMNVFSKALKNTSGYQVGQIDDVIVGRSIDPAFNDKGDDGSEAASDTSSSWSRPSVGSQRSHDARSSRSEADLNDPISARSSLTNNSHPTLTYVGPQRARHREKVLRLQGRSLPRLFSGRPEAQVKRTTPSSTRANNIQDAKILKEINAKCDKLQKQISITLMAPDKLWSQHGYFNTHQPAPITGPALQLRKKKEPIHAIYRSFQRMYETKPTSNKGQSGEGKPLDKNIPADEDEGNDNGNHNDNGNDNDNMAYQEEEMGDENNNNVDLKTRTFHLTELDDTDIDSDELSESDAGDFTSVALLKLYEADPTRQPSGEARYQGQSSKISEDEAGSQFHVVNGESQVSKREAYKIIKALDKDVYVDFEHKKYRRSGTMGSLGNPDNPRVHFLKVKVAETELK